MSIQARTEDDIRDDVIYRLDQKIEALLDFEDSQLRLGHYNIHTVFFGSYDEMIITISEDLMNLDIIKFWRVLASKIVQYFDDRIELHISLKNVIQAYVNREKSR